MGGAQTERRAPQELKRELERRLEQERYPGAACRRVEVLKTIAGGAVSFALPPTPKPSTTSRTGRGGGCKPAYGTLGQENRRGHWSAEAGGLVAFRRTDDGGRTIGVTRHWRGSDEYTEMGVEEADRTKREKRRAIMFWRARNPDESWRGGKGRDQAITDGKHRNLKIGTEFRYQFIL